jgi:hypothetical protein
VPFGVNHTGMGFTFFLKWASVCKIQQKRVGGCVREDTSWSSLHNIFFAESREYHAHDLSAYRNGPRFCVSESSVMMKDEEETEE